MMIRPSFRPLILLLCQLSLPSLVLAAESVTAPDVEWERTVKAAEQEGQVNVYKIASDSEWQAFQKKYPKIKVNLLHASAAQHLQRIMAERRAGKYLADVIRLGGGTSTSLYKAKAIDPLPPALLLPEVKDQSKWFEGRHQYNDVENQYVFIYAAFPLHLLDTIQKSSRRIICAVMQTCWIRDGRARLPSKIRAIPAARVLCCFFTTTRSWARSLSKSFSPWPV
jgi:hypothetical protein